MRKNMTRGRQSRPWRRVLLFAALLLPLTQAARAAELYAQAIGQPPPPKAPPPPAPERKPPPTPAAPPAAKPQPPPETVAKPAKPAADDNLRTRIMIGAAVAFALAALGGGGGDGGGADAPPTHAGGDGSP